MFKLSEDAGLTIHKAPVKADPHGKGINPVLPNFNSCMLLTGGPGSGKSTLIYNLLTNKSGGSYRGKFDHIFIFSPSQTLKFPGIPKECCIPNLDFDFIQDIMDDDEYQGKNILMVFDDVVQEMKANSKQLLKVMYNRRHIFNRHKNQVKQDKPDPLAISMPVQQCGMFGEPEGMTPNMFENLIEPVVIDPDKPKPKPEESDSDEEDDTGSLTIMMTTQKYNAIPLKFRTVSDAVFVFKPDMAEGRILHKELLCQFLPIQKTDAHFPLMEFVYDKPHNFIYINKAKDKIYKNFRRITLV